MAQEYFRPRLIVGHVIVLAAALTCLRLGWWQWEVFEAAGGTGQNLGYSLLWPVFSISFVYMWLRFLHLENSARDADRPDSATGTTSADSAEEGYDVIPGPATSPETGVPGLLAQQPLPRPRIAVGNGPQRGRVSKRRRKYAPDAESIMLAMDGHSVDDSDDPELAAYNRALAELAEAQKDQHRDE